MVEVIEYDNKFEKKVQDLIDRNFGDGYSSVKKLIGPNIKSFVAMSGENVIGYTSAIIQKKETILDLIVVHEKYRNLGIGERLFKVRLDTLNGNRYFRINHWIREISPKPFCAEKYGFKKKEILNSFWKDSSIRDNYECLECLRVPCRCKCAIYIKIV